MEVANRGADRYFAGPDRFSVPHLHVCLALLQDCSRCVHRPSNAAGVRNVDRGRKGMFRTVFRGGPKVHSYSSVCALSHRLRQ